MTYDPENKFFGQRLSDWMPLAANELIVIGDVSFCPMVSMGREGFELEGKELIDFMHEYIVRLIEKGATPIKPVNGHWIIQSQYGKTAHEISQNIVRDWQKNPKVSDDYDWLWFKILSDNEKSIWQIQL